MNLRNSILFILIFSLGAVSISLVYEVGKINYQSPVEVVKNPVGTVTETLAAVRNGQSIERLSPANHVEENQIKVFNNKVELDIKNAVWSRFTDTNSMDPFLDEGANGIEVIPSSENEIHVGDIVSYESIKGGIVIHRVVKIDEDVNGTYFVMKGDNNPIQDPEKVRFSQIKGILVGIIY
jgi:hypothetical protein